MRAITIPKECDITNEDAVIARDYAIAVSDGAGGGGVFADLWSHYLVEHLPEKPIKSYQAFDKWIDSIWEPFYNDCEKEAQKEGGMLLNKFYDEGSFATLVAVWKTGERVYALAVVMLVVAKILEKKNDYGDEDEMQMRNDKSSYNSINAKVYSELASGSINCMKNFRYEDVSRR